jgi:hypothetical protein
MALKVEGVVDGSMHTEKALGGSSRFEALHLALSSSYRLMRILGAIILPEPLFRRAGQPHTPERRGVRAQLVGHQQLRYEALLLEKLAHQPQRGRRGGAVPACRGPPSWSTARHRYIRSPAIRTTISSRCQRLLGRGRRLRSRRAITGPNFSTQLRFRRRCEPTLGKQILDVSVAEREAQVEPHSMLDDNRRKAVATISEFGHSLSLPATLLPSHPVMLTKPVRHVLGASAIAVPLLSSH